MATIAQQGENVTLTIQGNENVNIDELNFAVTLYLPNGGSEDIHTFYKKENDIGIFSKPKDNGTDIPYVWTGVIPARTQGTIKGTSDMKVGTYNMELLIGMSDGTNRSIFVNKNFLTIEYAVSKDISL